MSAAVEAPVDSRPCERCDKIFFRHPRQCQQLWDTRRFCSSKCRSVGSMARMRHKQRTKSGIKNCVTCERELTGIQLRFCSNDCANKNNRGGRQTRWKAKYHPMSYREIACELRLTVEQVMRAEASGLRKLRHNADAKRLMREMLSP